MLTVFGSLQAHITMVAPPLAAAGAPVMAGSVSINPGGKGANQALAARRFGAPTRLFGSIGDDCHAQVALAPLSRIGVDLSGLHISQVHDTGTVLTTRYPTGEHTVMTVPGANASSVAAQVPDAVLGQTRVVLMQLELPAAQCAALARRARAHGCMVVLNASPMPASGLVDLTHVDLVIVSATELTRIGAALGVPDSAPDTLARRVAARTGASVLVTLGADGFLLSQHGSGPTHCPALSGRTAEGADANDIFAGVFAAGLADYMTPADAMQAASVAAGLAGIGASASRAGAAHRRRAAGNGGIGR